MKSLLLTFLSAVAILGTIPAQTATDLNEGARLTQSNTPGAFTFSWFGRTGRTYFIQHSEDLALWTYVPVIESGANLPIQWGYTSTGDRFFLRLKASDIPTSDPYNADFDGDGVSNGDELVDGTDVFVPQAPFAPLGLTAVAGNALVSLAWNATRGSGVTYNVKRAIVSGGPYLSIISGLSTPKYFNSGLSNGITYYYVVSANRAGMTGVNSDQVAATPVALPGIPMGVTALSGNAAITLNWSPVSGATQYVVKRSTISGSGYTGFSGNTTTVPNLTDTQLANGTMYYYIVAARNGSGTSDYSSQVAAVPTASPAGGNPAAVPAAPTNFRATRISATLVRYEWDDNSNNEDGFIVTDENGAEIARVGPGVTSVEVDE